MTLQAVVIGGGIGGAAAALALAGIDVWVYEQARQLTEVGAGARLVPAERRDCLAAGLAGAPGERRGSWPSAVLRQRVALAIVSWCLTGRGF